MRVHRSWRSFSAVLSMLAITSIAVAHHGTSVSNDMENLLYTDAVLVRYTFTNPHPRVALDITNQKGEVERWECEGAGNPSMIVRWGWSRSEIERALQPGAKLKVGIARSRANPISGLVLEIFDENGNPILLASPKEKAAGYKYPGPGVHSYRGPG